NEMDFYIASFMYFFLSAMGFATLYPYMDSSFLQAFSLRLQRSVNAVAAIYPACLGGLCFASGPDGFPRVFISIILPASKAHALNGFLKTPV
ncbi:MAG: hypothetical protein ACU84H_01440, partial [Gammaproteobacteria bacterium]